MKADEEFRRCSPRRTRSSSALRRPSALSPPMLLIASSTFLAVRAHAEEDQQRQVEVALHRPARGPRCRRELTARSAPPTVEQVFQPPQSLLTLHQVRLTVSSDGPSELDRPEVRVGVRLRLSSRWPANPSVCFIVGRPVSPITRPGQHRVEFAVDQRFDHGAQPSP